MTSYKKFFVDFGFRSQKYLPTPNLSKIKPIFWQICKFLHFSVPQHIHNKKLPWQHLRLMRIVIICKMTPISVRLNLKNFILISCAVLELLREVSQGAESAPPGEIGLTAIPSNCAIGGCAITIINHHRCLAILWDLLGLFKDIQSHVT